MYREPDNTLSSRFQAECSSCGVIGSCKKRKSIPALIKDRCPSPDAHGQITISDRFPHHRGPSLWNAEGEVLAVRI